MPKRTILAALMILGGGLSAEGAGCVKADPRIESVAPAAGPAGIYAEITGRGFGKDNTVTVGGIVIRHVAVASSVAIACTTAADCRSGVVQTLKVRIPRKLKHGSQRIVVTSGGTASNAASFTVTR